MKKTHKHLIALSSLFILSLSTLSASAFFTGYAGGMLYYSANEEAESYDPKLDLSAFFSGQFNFSDNLWSHLEFSLQTADLLDQSLFSSTESTFQLDELSLIKRGTTLNGNNYFSAYMGTYDPIGSDIFLQRYFGLEPIGTKLADTYSGLAGSILFPHFGIGIADVIKPNATPIAYGGYLYLNNVDPQYYVLNADLRFATSLRYFTCDTILGIGAPLYDTFKGESSFLVINKLYLHAGTTILIGNNYTNALFMQAGLFNLAFEKGKSPVPNPNYFYFLFEPRFKVKNTHINLSLYSLPQDTVNKFLFVDDSLGLDLNVYSDAISIASKPFTFGIHANLGFEQASIFSLLPNNPFSDIDNLTLMMLRMKFLLFDVNVTPYFSTEIFNGQINAQAKIKVMNFITKKWYQAFSAEIGYKTSF